MDFKTKKKGLKNIGKELESGYWLRLKYQELCVVLKRQFFFILRPDGQSYLQSLIDIDMHHKKQVKLEPINSRKRPVLQTPSRLQKLRKQKPNEVEHSLVEIAEMIKKISQSEPQQENKKKKVAQYVQKIYDDPSNKNIQAQLRIILSSCFRISFENGKLILEQEGMIGESLIDFDKKIEIFVNFLKLSMHANSKYDKFYGLVEEMITIDKDALYWLNSENFSCLEILFQNIGCSQQSDIAHKLSQILEKQRPDLSYQLSRSLSPEYLWALFEAIEFQEVNGRLEIIEQLAELASEQSIDIMSFHLNESTNYAIKFLHTGMSEDQLKDIFSIDGDIMLGSSEEKEVFFKIIKIKPKQIESLRLDMQTNQEFSQIINKCKSPSTSISNLLTNAEVSHRQTHIFASVKKQDELFEGILIPVQLPSTSRYLWGIFNFDTWELQKISKSESMELKEKMNENNDEFKIQILNGNLTLLISTEDRRGKQINDETDSYPFYLFWYPQIYQQPVEQNDMDETLIEATGVEEPNVHDLITMKTYKYLGSFLQYFGINIDSMYIEQETKNIVTSDPQIIEYLDDWVERGMDDYLFGCFLDESQDQNIMKIELSNFKTTQKTIALLNEKSQKMQEKHQTRIEFSGEDRKIQIRKIKKDKQFVRLYLVEYHLKLIRQTLKSTDDHVGQQTIVIDIQNSAKQQQIESIKEENKTICLLSGYQAFTHFQTQQKSQFVKFEKQLTFTEKADNILEVEGKGSTILKFVQLFEKFKKIYYSEMEKNKTEYMMIPNEGTNIDMYVNLVKSIPKTTAELFWPHVRIRTTYEMKSQVEKALREQVELKLKKISIESKNMKEYQIKWVSENIGFAIQNRLTNMLRKDMKNSMSGAHIIMERLNGNEKGYKYILSKCDRNQEIMIKDQINFIISQYQKYTKYWRIIMKTNSTYVKWMKPFFSIKLTNKKLNEILKKIFNNYKSKIREKLKEATDAELNKLEISFINFLIHSQQQQFFWDFKEDAFDDHLTSNQISVFSTFLTSSIQHIKPHKRSEQIYDNLHEEFEILDNTLNEDHIIDQPELIRALTLLEGFITIYSQIKLPIINYLTQLQNLIKQKDDIIIKVGTGSGKSTVIPPFLVCLGFQKVFVTQPRRMACRGIYNRVSTTFGSHFVGYSYAGESKNKEAPLQYITDGLLKQLLQINPKLIADIKVLMIDQIHERSKSIDLILAMVPNLRKINPNLKIILCSATINEELIDVIDSQNSGIFEVEVSSFPVQEHKIEGKSLLQKAHELSLTLEKNQSMLIFLPSVQDVLEGVQIFESKYFKKAYPIYGSQNPQTQDDYLSKGQIFFCTSIAETSLTFPGLKYVLDSRISKNMMYLDNEKLNKLISFPSSKNSAKQRRGRVGRDGPGEYYYIEQEEKEGGAINFDLTELEKSDLTNVIYELLLSESSMKRVRKILFNLIDQSLEEKINNSIKKLQEIEVLENDGKSKTQVFTQFLSKFGNLGTPKFNYALYESMKMKCSYEMIAIISFLMYGYKILKDLNEKAELDQECKKQSGEIMKIAKFLIKMAQKIQLKTISLHSIPKQLLKFKEYSDRAIYPMLVKICQQMKKFIYVIDPIESGSWETVCEALINRAFKEDIYFHEQVFGGQKGYYNRYENRQYDLQNREMKDKIYYSIHRDNQMVKNKAYPTLIICLSAINNDLEDTVLSFCAQIPCIFTCPLTIIIRGEQPLLSDLDLIDEENILRSYVNVGGLKTDMNGLIMKFSGQFNEVVDAYKQIGEQRKNKLVKFDLSKLLEKQINSNYKIQSIIDQGPRLKRILKEQLQLYDIFSVLKYSCDNRYGVKLSIKRDSLVVQNALNSTCNYLAKQICSFFQWFSSCQNISTSDKKVLPRALIKYENKISKSKKQGIEKRINMVVDSSIDFHIVRNWGSGSKMMPYLDRTMKMIAVSWVLVTKFNCVIKGGFVRDWIIRGREYVPNGDLTNLLQKNPYNGFYQVMNEQVSPSDIDAELPNNRWFDTRYFQKEMKRIGIKTLKIVETEGWRKHVTFNANEPSGGFTADLIEPFCHISYDQCDFDVNLFYIQKDCLNSLGLKIPLILRQIKNKNDLKKQIQLEELVESCINRNIRQIRTEIYPHRLEKFRKKGWNFDNVIYQPVVYDSYKTSSHKVPISDFIKHNSEFLNAMKLKHPLFQIRQVLQLKNTGWDDCFDAICQWISSQGYDSNKKFLYHATDERGILGIFKNGFDSRYFRNDPTFYGNFGRGAYFSDDPRKADSYSSQASSFHNNYCLFQCEVALGNQEVLNQTNYEKVGINPGYHSVLGLALEYREYIVEKHGQAKPMYLIQYSR